MRFLDDDPWWERHLGTVGCLAVVAYFSVLLAVLAAVLFLVKWILL